MESKGSNHISNLNLDISKLPEEQLKKLIEITEEIGQIEQPKETDVEFYQDEITRGILKIVDEHMEKLNSDNNANISYYIEDLIKNKGFKLLENENILDTSNTTYFSLIGNGKSTNIIISYNGQNLYLQVEGSNEKLKIEKEKQPNLYNTIKVVEDRYGSNFYF